MFVLTEVPIRDVVGCSRLREKSNYKRGLEWADNDLGTLSAEISGFGKSNLIIVFICRNRDSFCQLLPK